jgi:uncharacterized HAD superfamily protein
MSTFFGAIINANLKFQLINIKLFHYKSDCYSTSISITDITYVAQNKSLNITQETVALQPMPCNMVRLYLKHFGLKDQIKTLDLPQMRQKGTIFYNTELTQWKQQT